MKRTGGIKPEPKLEAPASLSVQENQHNLQVQIHLPRRGHVAIHQHQFYTIKQN